MEPQQTQTSPQTPMQEQKSVSPKEPQIKNSLLFIMSILLLIAVTLAALFYFQIQRLSKQLTENTVPEETATNTPTQTPQASPTMKPGWKLYTNTKYEFEFIYPETYKVLTDPTNLYGWPKAVLLLYKGGQSYDMAVEIWNTEAEYKEKYNSSAFDIKVFKTGNKFITLLNTNKDAEITEVISSFKFTKVTPLASPTAIPTSY